jgi:hypothetical protein
LQRIFVGTFSHHFSQLGALVTAAAVVGADVVAAEGSTVVAWFGAAVVINTQSSGIN